MNEIVSFIRRRFSTDSSWLTGNCYFFALILKERFGGKIFYNPIEGHFVFQSIEGKYYDWNGIYNSTSKLLDWEQYKEIDSNHWARVMHDSCY